jgi:ribosomal protein S6--L-glutamate ligase
MKIGIISRAPNCYSTKRLVKSAQDKGHEVVVLDTLDFAIDLETGHPDLLYNHKVLPHFDAIIPRIGASVTYFGTSVVRQCQKMNIFCANSSEAISRSRDKLRSLQALSNHKIAFPRTSYVRGRKDIDLAIKRVGGAPLVIKLVKGSQGIGVMLAPSDEVARSILELLLSQNQRVLVQSFVEESKGRDIRAIVVGDKVVASMRRVASGDEFRSNVHRGGHTEVVNLDPDYERVAVESAKIMGLTVAGVDMLESKNGPQVLEINSSPGLEGIEKCTGVDVAAAIIDHISVSVEFPEIDVRQKLTMNTGYGVNEIHIPATSRFVGQTIEEMISSQHDINVLSLYRDQKTISNPDLTRVLKAKDVIVCYGLIDEMILILSNKKSSGSVSSKIDKKNFSKADENFKIALEKKLHILTDEYEQKTIELSDPVNTPLDGDDSDETSNDRTLTEISDEMDEISDTLTKLTCKNIKKDKNLSSDMRILKK